MPQRDIYHDAVVDALKNDGWTITDDLLRLRYGGHRFYVDLGAEQVIGAQKENRKIAVEIKSFVGPSDMEQLENALGQYNLYRDILTENEPDRLLYLALPYTVYWEIFNGPLGLLLLRRQHLRLIAFDADTRRILEWVPNEQAT
jgi:hypothetical protein